MKNDIANVFSQWTRPSVDSGKTRRDRSGRGRRRNRLFLETLEPRQVLSTITWNSPTGGDWDTNTNWSPAQVPGASDTAIITNLTGSGIVYLNSNKADTISGLTTGPSTHLEVITGSLSLGVASSSTLGGTVTV